MNWDWDYSLFKLINDHANNVSWYGKLLVDAANYGDYFFVISLVVLWLFHHKMSVYGFVAGVGSVLLARFISLFYFRNRPFVDHDVNQLLPHIDSNSFPSDHAAAAFAIATMIYFFSKRTGWFFLVCAGLVSFSRIWVGKHYPFDVVCGTALGIAFTVLIFRLLERFKPYEMAVGKWRAFRGHDEVEITGIDKSA
ncbi:MAG: phosphatase PAP2 family protein [Anoxybacillus mongoliensis]|nr:phosphatase PAP2 family protein [Anoxybacillus mongoliensis]